MITRLTFNQGTSRKNPHFGLIALLMAAVIIIMIYLSSCRTTREVNIEKKQENIKTDFKTEQHDTSSTVTTTDSHVTSETEISESIDTVVKVKDHKGEVQQVPVRIHRHTKKKEYADVNQVKTEKKSFTRNDTLSQDLSTLSKERKVDVKRVSPWQWIIPTACGTITLLIVIFWKKLPLTSLFSFFSRKSL